MMGMMGMIMLLVAGVFASPVQASESPTVLITGSDKGIGLALVSKCTRNVMNLQLFLFQQVPGFVEFSLVQDELKTGVFIH